MNLVTLLAAIAALMALLYLALCARPPSAARSGIKTASVACLALMAWVLAAPVWLVLALSLCALGDFCLSRAGERAFMAGVGAFAAGHLAYVVLFLSDGSSQRALLFAAPQIWVAVVLLALGAGMIWLLLPRAGEMKVPVALYVPIILAMGLSALTLDGARGWTLVVPAALSFMASDVILAVETFVLGEEHPLRRITPYAVWPLYWGAQASFLLAFS